VALSQHDKVGGLALRTGRSDDSFPTFFAPLGLAQTDPWSPTVPLDEVDAGGLQRAANGQVIGRGHRRLVFGELSPTDGSDPEGGRSSKIFSAPPEQSTGGSDLSTGQRP
jgi:hypothetical protein